MNQSVVNSAGSALANKDKPSSAVGWWVTGVLFIFYALSFTDRQILNLLVEPIKASLNISDFQVSLLQGFAFAIFYTVFGVGIGWLVDNKPRRPIIFFGVVFWSLATAGCGLASRYWQLALARIGVAVGEASLAPAAYSLMSDVFPARRLALPMSVMGAGAPLGAAFAMFTGSYILGVLPNGLHLPIIGEIVSWQLAFLAVGVPGLLLAPLIWTIHNPSRPKSTLCGSNSNSASDVIRYLASHKRFYAGHFLGFGVFSMINYAVSAWLPTFLMRRHHFELGEAGYVAGGLVFFVALPGSLLMGWLVDRWYSLGRHDAHLLAYAGCTLIQLVSICIAVLVADPWLAIIALIPHTAVAGFTGVAAAALQITTPARMRGQASAIYLLVFNLLGMGCGPSVVAIFTDFVFKDELQVGYSLLLTYIIFAPVAIFLLLYAAPAMRIKTRSMVSG